MTEEIVLDPEELGPGESQVILKKNDVALVIREEGPQEIHLPKMEDGNAIVPQYVIVLVAISLRLKDEAFVEDLLNWFDKRMEAVEGNSALTGVQGFDG